MNIDLNIRVELEIGAQTLALLAQGARTAAAFGDPNTYSGSGAARAYPEATEGAAPGPSVNNVVDMPTKAEPAKRTRKPKETPAEEPQIRTSPEDRQEAALDKAQELGQEAEQQAGNAPKTHDDVRNALTLYGERYGMNSAMEDGPRVLELRFGKGVTKVSQIPDTQEALGQILDDIAEMTDRNPWKRSANV